jgi:hypothetical protein
MVMDEPIERGAMGVTTMIERRRLMLVCALVASCCMSCKSAPPALVLTDPIDGGPVPVSCAGVDVEVCKTAANATLDYLTPDFAGVEAVRVEPLADAPAGSEFAVRVTLDHKMFLNPGLQPYHVVQGVATEPIEVTPIDE